MPDEAQPSPEELARQVRQHLASLRAAGVEWLPLAPASPSSIKPLPPVGQSSPVPQQVQSPVPASAPSLFAEADSPKPSSGPPAVTPSSESLSLTPDQRR